MKFGIQHGMGDPNWQPEILAPEAVIGFAKAVEDGGYAHLAFTDHPAPSSRWVNAGGEGVSDLFTSLGFCAAVTKRVGLLSWVMVVPYHNPLMAAHRIATLDALSGGRVTLGIGTGYLKSEFFAMGADFNDRRNQFDESLAVMKQALTGEDVTAEGPGYSAKDTQVMPPVVQRPHPPMWIHGNGEFGLKRAAEIGEGWIGLFTTDMSRRTIRTTAIPDLDAYGRRIEDLQVAVDKAGRKPEDVKIIASGVVPIIDIRAGWDKDAYIERFEALEALGVDTVVINAIGDDAAASEESAISFAEDFIA